jgi:hypothetical protein
MPPSLQIWSWKHFSRHTVDSVLAMWGTSNECTIFCVVLISKKLFAINENTKKKQNTALLLLKQEKKIVWQKKL